MNDTDDLGALLDAHEKKQAEALDAQFTPIAWVCHNCAALVMNREHHHGFHQAIEQLATTTADAIMKLAKAI
ncbi:hypothetical protein [Nocardia asiatica]|uniref:hypothetical protein n=1 Tax=Nocardia asiatica TaxID=209252 RepID=UPI002457B820|nr:hypothetical protein [Nocardia asiatica]